MGGTVLNTTVKEKDLGLTISADMKVSEQCGIAAAKANQKNASKRMWSNNTRNQKIERRSGEEPQVS